MFNNSLYQLHLMTPAHSIARSLHWSTVSFHVINQSLNHVRTPDLYTRGRTKRYTAQEATSGEYNTPL